MATESAAPAAGSGAPSPADPAALSPQQFIEAFEAEMAASGQAQTGAEPTPTQATASAPEAPTEGEKPAEEATPVDDKPPTEEKPAEPAETPDAAMARARKALGAAAKRERVALEREQKATATLERYKRIEDVLGIFEAKPLEALTSLLGKDRVGPWLDKLAKEGDDVKAPTADDRVAAIEKQLAEERAGRQKAEQEAQVRRVQADLTDRINKAGDRFELIVSTGQHDLVWQTLEAAYERDGVAPDPMVVADAVEKHLEDQLLAKVAGSKKFQARVAAKATPSGSAVKPQKQSPGAVTLDNTATAAVPATGDSLPSDPEDRHRALMRELGLAAS